MKIAAIQHDIIWEDPQANHERLAPLIEQAATAGTEMIVLTEMYATGFSMNSQVIAEPPDGRSVNFLLDQAQTHEVWVAASVPVKDKEEENPVNRMVLAGPAGENYHYDKRYPFSFAQEDQHYRAGDKSTTVSINEVRYTLTICYDLRFSDAYWPSAPETDCYLVVANWPETRRHHWRTLLVARAIENQAYVVGVNRVGSDPNVSYSGDSLVVDPLGEIIAECPPGMEATIVAEIDPEKVKEIRTSFPFMDDRKT
tara:strand:+ start:135 stop:899 length:765 start_codon:yes stop_codon:yes gene_type:complete